MARRLRAGGGDPRRRIGRPQRRALALEVARELDDPDAMVVTILCDTGERYLSKVFNDEWMQENQMLEAPQVDGRSSCSSGATDGPGAGQRRARRRRCGRRST